MPLQKLQFRPGLNREGTDYSNEGGWFDGDKIRFRSGFPEKIGGWTQVSPNQYLGIARSLWLWADGDAGVGNQYIGVGTSIKYYIFSSGVYNDITPIVQSNTLTNPFTTVNTSTTVTVADANYFPNPGDYVIFSGSTSVGGLTLNGEFLVQTSTGTGTYTITSQNAATSSATGGGTVTAQYELPSGLNVYSVGTGWGAGPWGGPIIPVLKLLGTNAFSATSGSSTVQVTQTAHGMTNGSYVAFTGATTFAGIPASMLNDTFQISSVATNTYNITLPSSFTATSTTTGGGTSAYVTEQTPLPIVAGSFVVGKAYVISYVGTTNFTLIGSSDNNLGTIFTATGVGSGTGTASLVLSPSHGWGSAYSSGVGSQLRLWSNDNYGADLVIAPRGGGIYYWQDSGTVGTRAQPLANLANSTVFITDNAASVPNTGTTMTVSAAVSPSIYPFMVVSGNANIPTGTQVASTYITGSTTVPLTKTLTGSGTVAGASFAYDGAYVPTQTYQVIASSIQEFIIAFGANPYVPGYASGTGLSTFNPLLVRWSDQGNAYQWIPQTTNQAGEYALTNGSYIMGARTTRQEILVWTDSCIYSMQYLGAPYVWGFQVLMDNISIMSPNSMITINNVTYWMGKDRFYMYSGRVEVLPCALRQYIFDDINQDQTYQIFAGANEAYNEIWWYYVSQSSSNTVIDKYIIYNYLDRVWYYGTMGRTAWMQTGTQPYPIAADYNGRLLYHEVGCDDLSTSTTLPIDAYVQSSDFDIGDGHNFGFVWRILPDVNFNGSTTNQPSVTMTVKPRENSGTPYGQADNPQVQSTQNYTTVPEYTIQQFDGQVYTRLRGRQMSFRIESTGVGVAWQLGSPRIDIRPDGRR